MQRLFEAVVVAGATSDKDLTPKIHWYYQPPQSDDISQLRATPTFCFPDETFLKPVFTMDSETFTFVLTASDGGKQFGYCRRYLPPGLKARSPEVVCIISRWRSFAAFSRLVGVMEDLAKYNPEQLKHLAESLLLWDPQSAASVLWLKIGPEPLAILPRLSPDICSFSDSRLVVLMEHLGVTEVIALHHMVMCEQRVILYSSHVSTITACASAIAALLYPLQWQQVFIPLLPKSLLSYVCAPMPFLIGVPADFLPEVKKLPMEEVVFVDLDNGVINADPKALAVLPKRQSQAMALAIQQRYIDSTSGERRCTDWRGVSFVFFEFMLYLLGNYRSFIRWKGETAWFDRDGFVVAHSSKSIRKMLAVIQHSQMFEVFSREREDMAMSKMTGDSVFEHCMSILSRRAADPAAAFYNPSFLDRGATAATTQALILSATKRYLIPSKPDASTVSSAQMIDVPVMEGSDPKTYDRCKYWGAHAPAPSPIKPESKTAKTSPLISPMTSTALDNSSAVVDVPTADLLGILAAPEVPVETLHRAKSIQLSPALFPAQLDLRALGSPPLHAGKPSEEPSLFDLDFSKDPTPRERLLDLGDLGSVSSSGASTPATSVKIAATKPTTASLLDNGGLNEFDVLSLTMTAPLEAAKPEAPASSLFPQPVTMQPIRATTPTMQPIRATTPTMQPMRATTPTNSSSSTLMKPLQPSSVSQGSQLSNSAPPLQQQQQAKPVVRGSGMSIGAMNSNGFGFDSFGQDQMQQQAAYHNQQLQIHPLHQQQQMNQMQQANPFFSLQQQQQQNPFQNAPGFGFPAQPVNPFAQQQQGGGFGGGFQQFNAFAQPQPAPFNRGGGGGGGMQPPQGQQQVQQQNSIKANATGFADFANFNGNSSSSNFNKMENSLGNKPSTTPTSSSTPTVKATTTPAAKATTSADPFSDLALFPRK